MDLIAGLLFFYLFLVFLKQALNRRKEIRGLCFTIALAIIPLLAMTHFFGRWDLTDASAFNQLGHFWTIQIHDPDTKIGHPFNLVKGGLIVSLIYVGATILVLLFSGYYWLKRGDSLLSIHRLLIKLAVMLIGMVVYFKYENIDLTPLWVGMGAASLVVGIALQEPLSSLFKGVALDMEGVFRRGEWIRVGGSSGYAGKVVEKNWRTTKILTIDDELITLPNSLLGSEMILNYHQPETTHVQRIQVGTSYNDPPVKVKEVLRTILIREPRVVKDPPPQIRTIAYNDFSIDYELKYWIRDYGQHPGIRDAIMTQIWYAFKFYGIEIPFPIRTVHMKQPEHLDEEQKVITNKEQDIRSFLVTLPYFSRHLTHNYFDFLARNSFKRFYSPGELVINKGEMGDAIYIVREGLCEVVIPSGERRPIKEGEYFGEMGLISRAPRSADVMAGSEGCTTIRVDRECMQILFKKYESLYAEFELVKKDRMEDSGLGKDRTRTVRKPLVKRLGGAVKDLVIPW